MIFQRIKPNTPQRQTPALDNGSRFGFSPRPDFVHRCYVDHHLEDRALFFPFFAVLLSITYFLGWSPADNRRISSHILFRPVAVWVSILRVYGAGLSYWASMALIPGVSSQRIPFVSPWRVGLTIAGAAFFVSCFSPWVEWWVERLSQRRLAVVGIVFAIIGFLLQAFPNWIVLLQN